MTVQELIEELQSHPKDCEVVFWDGEDNLSIRDVQGDSFDEELIVIS